MLMNINKGFGGRACNPRTTIPRSGVSGSLVLRAAALCLARWSPLGGLGLAGLDLLAGWLADWLVGWPAGWLFD